MRRRALVIGGSMSGLLAARMLRERGWDVDVFERVESELSGRGAGIVAQAELIAILEALRLDTRDLGVERETRQRWPVGEMRMVHRTGHLGVGEVSVAVAVSCPHRAQAFEACRHAIDRLKELVPIWKKENWADGRTEWVHPGAEQ